MMFILFHLLVLLVFTLLNINWSYCNDANYWNSGSYINAKQQVPCKLRSNEPARHCIDYELTVKTRKEKLAILDKINSRRNKVASGEIRSFTAAANMLKLEWNTELEISAQSWANQCVKHSEPDIEDSCRDLGNITVGQNIATVFGESPGLSAATLVDVWYMELLHTNSSVISSYESSKNKGHMHYDYFTQLIWAVSTEVGCGGVKFKELLKDTAKTNRTVYRLVCNFAPGGNHYNKTVYLEGTPCTKCSEGGVCDSEYKALCRSPLKASNVTTIFDYQDTTQIESSPSINSGITDQLSEGEELITEGTLLSSLEIDTEGDEDMDIPIDYLSLLHDLTSIESPSTTPIKPKECKDMLDVDDFIDMLKKKLIDDPVLKTLLSGNSSIQTSNSEIREDSNVAAFVRRVYSSKEPTSTIKSSFNDYINSTLLVDLVEAVIFRSGDKTSETQKLQPSTTPINVVSPVKISAELAEVQPNPDFTGHYFFPEDDLEATRSETTEAYYDTSDILETDIVLEIDDLMKSSTKNFLDEILLDEFETETESTITTTKLMSPDDLNLHKEGYRVMKKFLKDIDDQSRKTEGDN